MNYFRKLVFPFIITGIAGCAQPRTLPGTASCPFDGKWYWENESETNSFFVSLTCKGDSILGTYCAAYNRGSRLDCSGSETEYNIRGKVDCTKAVVGFYTFFDGINGTATLEMGKSDSALTWKITNYPTGGGCFAPESAHMAKRKL
jgi:hypothetical protein